MSNPKENTVKIILQIIEKAEEKIEEAISKGVCIPATELARAIAPSFGLNWGTVYQMIGVYIKNNPSLVVRGGPKGGIGKADASPKKNGSNVLDIDALDSEDSKP